MHIRRALFVLAFAAAVILALPTAAYATTKYVSTTGSDTSGAGTQANPYRTVQKAINVSSSGDLVHVGAGTFSGSIVMKNGVSLEAQGAGTGTFLTELTDTTNFGSVVTATNIGAGTHISGFKIDGGTSGWGIFCSHSSLAITDDWVTGNVTGIGCYDSSSPTIQECEIKDNTGIGVVCNDSSPTILGNMIYQNHADSILCTATASPSIADNYISSNWSGSRGVRCSASSPSIIGNTLDGNTIGVDCVAASSPSITGNTFIAGNGPASIRCDASAPVIDDNTLSPWSGDGIDCFNGSAPTITRTTINCGTGGGDGIYCDTASSPTITDCTITGEGDWENSYGIVCFNSSAPTVTNCAISGCNYNIWCNTGSSPTVRNCTLSGGYNGFACRESSPIVVNCVISGNEQGVYFDSGSPTFTNDTIVFNSAEGINGYVAATPTITNCIVWNPDATAELIECTATYSDIRGGAVGTGNINADPNFTSAHTGDFRLNAGSPCIDAATSVGAPATDREGTPRPQGGGFDMGAYENHPATCLLQYASADANGSIIGVATQVVSFNGSGTSVTASPATGYHFVEWSDHSTANPRTDVNVTADADYTATFAINTYTLSYAAGTGGSLEGSATQVLVHGSSTTAVTAVPNEGYVFVRWSDGVTTAERTDVNVTANLNVTANFAATTTLVLSTKSKSGIAYGTKVSLAGTLKAGLAPVAGRQVIVRTSTNGTTFTDSSLRPTTIATGAFSVAASPSTKTWYCVRFAGDSGYLSYGPTAAIYLTPKAYVGNPVAPSTMSKTSYYSVYAYLKPRHSAGTNPVRIYRYRYVSGSWRQYGTYVTAKAANYSTYSKCSVKMKLPYTGKWRLRAYHSDAGHSTAWSSGYDYVTVK